MTGPRFRLTSLFRLVAGLAIVGPAALLLGAPPAEAHPLPHSVVQLDVSQSSVAARLELPRTSGIDLSGATSTAVPADRADAGRPHPDRVHLDLDRPPPAG